MILSPVLFNLALEHAIRGVMRTEIGLDLNGTTPVLGYADDLLLLSEDTETINLNTITLMKAGKKLGLEINMDKTKYLISCKNGDIAGDIDIEGNMFEHVEKFRYLRFTITRKNEIEDEIKVRLKTRNACYFSVTKLLSSPL